jgi:hypothetical protein
MSLTVGLDGTFYRIGETYSWLIAWNEYENEFMIIPRFKRNFFLIFLILYILPP